jgi:hypothetical protein
VKATCGDFIFSEISIGLSPLTGKSQYSAVILEDNPDTPVKDGCITGDRVTFLIKGNEADQGPIPCELEVTKDYDISYGTSSLIFLPIIRR